MTSKPKSNDVEDIEEMEKKSRMFGLTQDEKETLDIQQKIQGGIRKEYQTAKLNLNRFDKFIISHDNPKLQVWNVFISILTIVSAFGNMYIVAFNHSYYQVQTNDEFSGVNLFMLVLECLFLFDIFIKFLTEFTEFTDDSGLDKRPVRDIFRIAKRYLTDKFIIDLIAFYPFLETIEHIVIGEQKEKKQFTYIHLMFILRLMRLYKAVELLDPRYIFLIIRSGH